VEQYGEVFSEPMRAGDVMAFHNLTLHSTCPNERSDRVRWSIDLRYMRTGEGFAWHKLGDTFDVQ
jgi:ectoine hydroxylase-related dioxygenase (phytanoyl-CoA dioxygenase family)